MPYEISWLVEKRVVYTRMYGFVTGEELANQNKDMTPFVKSSVQLLHTITDATDGIGTDVKLRDLQKANFTDIDNLGWAIYVSPSKMNRFFASVITQLSHKRGRQFATLEEALNFLSDIDDTLPPITIGTHSLQTE